MSLHQQNYCQCSLLHHIITSSAFLTCLPSVPVRRNIGGVSSFGFFFPVVGYYKINMREGVGAGTYFSGSDEQQVAKYNIKLRCSFLLFFNNHEDIEVSVYQNDGVRKLGENYFRRISSVSAKLSINSRGFTASTAAVLTFWSPLSSQSSTGEQSGTLQTRVATSSSVFLVLFFHHVQIYLQLNISKL